MAAGALQDHHVDIPEKVAGQLCVPEPDTPRMATD
jgi:hypothetical protein